jgi:ribonucleoside-diphosphate reductase alpha chain
MTRECLANRRVHKSFAFELAGVRYLAGIGRFSDGRLAEVFLNGNTNGTDLDTGAKDAAIVASLALQYGVPCDGIRHALTRNRDGTATGPLGVVLDLLAAPSALVSIDQNAPPSSEESAP